MVYASDISRAYYYDHAAVSSINVSSPFNCQLVSFKYVNYLLAAPIQMLPACTAEEIQKPL